MPKPRKYWSNAERQAAYRQRHQQAKTVRRFQTLQYGVEVLCYRLLHARQMINEPQNLWTRSDLLNLFDAIETEVNVLAGWLKPEEVVGNMRTGYRRKE